MILAFFLLCVIGFAATVSPKSTIGGALIALSCLLGMAVTILYSLGRL